MGILPYMLRISVKSIKIVNDLYEFRLKGLVVSYILICDNTPEKECFFLFLAQKSMGNSVHLDIFNEYSANC